MSYSANLAALKPEDVLLASFPRSGNTWMRLLLSSLLRQTEGNSAEVSVFGDFQHYFPEIYLEFPLDDGYIAMPGVGGRFIKTHDIYNIYEGTRESAAVDPARRNGGGVFGKEPLPDPLPRRPRRCIYLFRRPDDAISSMFNLYGNQLELEEFAGEDFNDFCLKHLDWWCQHVQSYLDGAAGGGSHMVFVSYETMSRDPAPCLRMVCDFIGLEVTDAMIATTLEANSFDRVKDRHSNIPKQEFVAKAFARGKVGGWREKLSEETFAAIEMTCLPTYEAAQARERACLAHPPGRVPVDAGDNG